MSISRKAALKILKAYGEAWTEQDTAKILSIFNENGTYAERAFKKPFRGHKEIAAYWQSKVVEEQSKIKFKLLNAYLEGNTIIAEWDASFNSSKEKALIHIREVAIIQVRNGKIQTLREYWQSEKTHKR